MSRLPRASRGRAAVRFPANSSHICCVELALKGLASAGKGLLYTGFPQARGAELYLFWSTFPSLWRVMLQLSRRMCFPLDTGSCLFVVSCDASYLVVWPIGSNFVSGFGLLSVFSPEWIRALVIFGSTSVRA